MLNSIRNVKFIQMQKLTNVYHCCFCFIFDQTTMGQEQKSDTILVLLNFFAHEKVNE